MFYQCQACTVVVRCNECGGGAALTGRVGNAPIRLSRSAISVMTSKKTRTKGKCYHEDPQTFNMSDTWEYFEMNYRANNKLENLQAKCIKCNKALLWVKKKK